jgi:hypothetical protein
MQGYKYELKTKISLKLLKVENKNFEAVNKVLGLFKAKPN